MGAKLREMASREVQLYRDEIDGLLEQCTEPQRVLFKKVFPDYETTEDTSKLKTAVSLCARTVAKNNGDSAWAGA